MSIRERRKIARELGIKLSEVNEDTVADYREVTKGRTQRVPNIVLNPKEWVSAIRIFNKKSYRYHGFRETKTSANTAAIKLRQSGYLIRIVPGRFKGKKIYNLYKAERKK